MVPPASAAIAQPQLQPPAHSQPAGGPDPDRFDWLEAWHPLFFVQDLDPTQLHRFTLLDQDLVIWWEPQAEIWRVFKDQCPHRLAPLSEGRINPAGQLECPYHGWAFSGEGDCEVIPQQAAEGKAHTAQRACAKSLPTVVHQGLLFAYPGNPENAETTAIPTVDPLKDGEEDWVVLNMFRDIPYDALTLLENVLDPSHLPYTHHKSVGNRVNAGPTVMELLTHDKTGFTGIWPEGPRLGKLGTQNTTFVAPNLMWHDLTSKQFGRTMTVVYATPISKGKCRLFARFPFQFPSKIPAFFIKSTPTWYSHLNQNGVLEDDQVFLHFQERYLEKLGGGEAYKQAFYLATKADTFVAALRDWVNQYDADPFPGQALPPAIAQKDLLLDRYSSHTQHCQSCRGALRNVQRGKVVAGAIAILAWALATLLPVFWTLAAGPTVGLVLLAIASLGARFGLTQLERRFYEGRAVPPRNLPEKVK